MREQFPYSYRVINLDLTPGMTDLEFPMQGERIDYIGPTDGPEISLRLQAPSNDKIPFRPNGSIEAPFTRLYVSASATARTISLMIGSPSSVKVTGRDVAFNGSIATKDQLYNAAINAACFQWSYSINLGANPLGFYTKWQLFNPSGNTKSLLVHKLFFRAGSAISVTLTRHNVAIGSLGGTYGNVLLGGSNPTAEPRVLTDVTLPGTPILWDSLQIPANTDYVTPDRWFWVIPPGQSLLVRGGGTATLESLTVNWMEV